MGKSCQRKYFTGLRLMPPALLVKNLPFLRSHFFLTAKKPKRKFDKNQPKIYPISTQNRPKVFLGQVFVGPWGVLAGKLATRVDFGRFWNPPNPPDGTVLSPSWSHVGAKLKYFGVESVILEVLKSKTNSSRNWNRCSQNFEAKPRWCEGNSVL